MAKEDEMTLKSMDCMEQINKFGEISDRINNKYFQKIEREQ